MAEPCETISVLPELYQLLRSDYFHKVEGLVLWSSFPSVSVW